MSQTLPEPLLFILPDRSSKISNSLSGSLNSTGNETIYFPLCIESRDRRAWRGRGADGSRWADEDRSLRWQFLKSLLDTTRFRAIGFSGARLFSEAGERVLEYAGRPAFVFLTEEDLKKEALLSNPLWTRGARRLNVVLCSNAAVRRQLEKLLAHRLPYRVAAASEDTNWVRWLDKAVKRRTEFRTIITPVFNKVDYTRRCVQSVLANTAEPFEWIIIDNGSSDATPRFLADLARRHRRIRIITNKQNLGFARAVNQGIRRARRGTLVILNNDTVVPQHWIEGLQSALDCDPGLGAVGPCTNEAADVYQHRNSRYNLHRFDSFAAAWSLQHAGRVRPIHRLIGFCMAIRWEAKEQVGQLDERFSIGGYEDYDYCLRLRQSGWRLAVAEEVFVHHFGHVSYQNRDKWLDTVAKNRDVFLEKWTRKSLEFLDNISDLRRAEIHARGNSRSTTRYGERRCGPVCAQCRGQGEPLSTQRRAVG